MARRRGRQTRRSEAGAQPGRGARAVAEGVEVEAVKATSGRAATTVHVDVAPERVRQLEGAGEVKRVVAEIPRAEEGAGVRWEEQPLAKAAEEQRPDGARTIRYSATRMDGEDAARYGIGVRIETEVGALRTPPGGVVKGADKPEE